MIYVLQVESGKEMAVLGEMKKQPCHPMVPRQILVERRNGKDFQRESILFAGYVFIDTALDLQEYYRIKAIPHVIRFLGGGDPLTLPASEAEYIHMLANGDKPLLPVVFWGDGSIKSELLKDLQSRGKSSISFNKRQRRAKVTMTLLGEQHEISLAAEIDGEAGEEADDKGDKENGGTGIDS